MGVTHVALVQFISNAPTSPSSASDSLLTELSELVRMTLQGQGTSTGYHTGVLLTSPSPLISLNRVSARISATFGFKGPCEVMFEPQLAFWGALDRAANWIRQGSCGQVLLFLLPEAQGDEAVLLLLKNTRYLKEAEPNLGHLIHSVRGHVGGVAENPTSLDCFVRQAWSAAACSRPDHLVSLAAAARVASCQVLRPLAAPLPHPLLCLPLKTSESVQDCVWFTRFLSEARGGCSSGSAKVAINVLDEDGHLLHFVLAREERQISVRRESYLQVTPASCNQQAVWLMEALSTDNFSYHLPGALQLQGAWSAALLEEVVGMIIERHAALRTALFLDGEEVVQAVCPATDWKLTCLDLNGLDSAGFQAIVEQLRRAPFKLEEGKPARFYLLRRPDGLYIYWVLHHACFDGVSSSIMLKEMMALYRGLIAGGPALRDPEGSYADFTLWQREMLASSAGDALRSWWGKQLAGVPAHIQFPTQDHLTFKPADGCVILQSQLGSATCQNLKRVVKGQKATLFTLLITGYMVVLNHFSRQMDLALVTPFAGRPSSRFDGTIGYFINMIVLRLKMESEMSLADLLTRSKAMVADGLDHGFFPFAQLLDALDMPTGEARLDVFQTCFVFQNWIQGKQARLYERGQEDVSMSVVDLVHETGGHHLTLEIFALPHELLLYWKYDPSRFGAGFIEDMDVCFRQLVSSFEQWLLCPLSSLAFESPVVAPQPLAECPVVLPTDGHPLHLIENHSGHGLALVLGETSCSYAQLWDAVCATGHHLRQAGVGAETVVAFLGRRSEAAVVAMLAISWAGATAMPIDPNCPAHRLLPMLVEANCTHLLGPQLPFPLDYPLTGLPIMRGRFNREPTPLFPPDTGAYCMFTSGSSGRPKGVLVSRGNLTAFVAAAIERYGFDAQDRVLQFANLGFDTAIEEIWAGLAAGASLVLRDDEMLNDLQSFVQQVNHHGVTVLDLPTAFWHQLCDSGLLPSLEMVRTVIIGGERAQPAQIRSLLEMDTRFSVWNTYGPTEATVVAAAWQVNEQWLSWPEVVEVPIGFALEGVLLHVVDPLLVPVGRGVVGELCIGGKGVARGYLKRPALTASSFVPDPFSGEPGARMYRSGDLVVKASIAGAPLVFAGRLDQQIKIRGFRVEPAEVEYQLLAFPGVQGAIVGNLPSIQGENRLVSWLVAAPELGENEGIVRNYLKERLPAYMVPEHFLFMKRFPLTARGKLDKKALPDPQNAETNRQALPRPAGFEEQLLAEIWCEVLGLGAVGPDENFFELGGHSLSATRVSSRVRRVFRKELKLRDFFKQPTIHGLASLLRGDQEQRAVMPIETRRDALWAPLSPAQTRLWFVSQLAQEGNGYIVSLAIKMTGALRMDCLEEAFQQLVARHSGLRTAFAVPPGKDEPQQYTCSQLTIPLKIVDLRALGLEQGQSHMEALARVGAGRPMLLEKAPLVTPILVLLAPGSAVLQLHVHHMICDAWSIDVLMGEWGQLYASAVSGVAEHLPELPIQYADYARWQSERVQSESLKAGRLWWKNTLADAPDMLTLPHDFPRPKQHKFKGATLRFEIDPQLYGALMALSSRVGVTLFSSLLAGFKVLLARYAGSQDILVGSPVANRKRLELEHLVGFFVNTLVLRTTLPGGSGPGFEDLVVAVHQNALEAFAHEEVSFETLVEDLGLGRNLAHNPLFQVTFQYLFAPSSSTVAGVNFQGLDLDYGSSRFDMGLNVSIRNGVVTGYLEYNTALFKASTIQRFCQHYVNLLTGLVAQPNQPVLALPFLLEEERCTLLGVWSKVEAPFPQGADIAGLFEKVCGRSGQADALCRGAERLSFSQLNLQANRLAFALKAKGVAEGDFVGVCLRGSVELIVTLVAILKCGAAYVSMDPDYPMERLVFMVKDADLRLVVTSHPASFMWSESLVVLDPKKISALLPEHNPARVLQPARAYICYTSGSTGTPKGVVVRQDNILRLVFDTRYVQLESSDRFAQVSNPAFDALTFEVWTALLHGLPLVLVDKHSYLQPAVLSAIIAAQGVTVMFMTPAVFNQCARDLPSMFASMRFLLLGGDQADMEMVRRVAAHGAPMHLLNAYGPTENTTFSTWSSLLDVDEHASHVPIGTPITNSSCYVLDELMQPVPMGVLGELYVGGFGLAEGYLGCPGLTARAFVPNCFSSEAGARLYKTGDLVRHTDGTATLSFCGRVDDQVKIRGFRVEPGEVEIWVKRHPAVVDAVVRAVLGSNGDRFLVAWVVGGEIDQILHFLRENLPDYMVPLAMVPIDEIPLNANGKVDWRALPDAEEFRYCEERCIVTPRNGLEEKILDIWSTLLGQRDISVFDNLFRLGAHSLMMARASSRLWDSLGLSLPLDVLFEHASVAGLAQYVEIARWTRTAGDESGTFEEEGVI